MFPEGYRSAWQPSANGELKDVAPLTSKWVPWFDTGQPT